MRAAQAKPGGAPPAPQINTHPSVIRAAAEVFRRWEAREVLVAEGQGHCRDSLYVLDESGLGTTLSESRLEFIDLNHDDVESVPNALGFTSLAELMLPVTLRRADLIVSMPKLKTHHWVGVTLSMKNLFGVMPGVCYGWPKNVLHHAGIPESILDIAGTVRPHLAIVDGIIGMEGDGPIMGTAKPCGLLVMGTNLPAVDATCTRLMGLDPWRISYLAEASGRLGPIAESHIAQRERASHRSFSHSGSWTTRAWRGCVIEPDLEAESHSSRLRGPLPAQSPGQDTTCAYPRPERGALPFEFLRCACASAVLDRVD